MDGVAQGDLTGRARLRRAALELFAERGFEATSTRAVAARAGLSPALVTRHFGSRDGLRAAVDADVLERIRTALSELEPAPGEPRPQALMVSLGEVSARCRRGCSARTRCCGAICGTRSPRTARRVPGCSAGCCGALARSWNG